MNKVWASNIEHDDIVIDNTVLYNWNLLREKNVLTKKTNKQKVNMGGDRCVN